MYSGCGGSYFDASHDAYVPRVVAVLSAGDERPTERRRIETPNGDDDTTAGHVKLKIGILPFSTKSD